MYLVYILTFVFFITNFKVFEKICVCWTAKKSLINQKIFFVLFYKLSKNVCIRLAKIFL